MQLNSLLIVFLQLIVISFGYPSIPFKEYGLDQSKNTILQYFLPNTSIPHHYDIDLNVFLGPQYKYNGNVDINVTVFNETNKIILHASDLKIINKRSFMLNVKTKQLINITTTEENKLNGFLTVNLKSLIKPGKYVLRLGFEGQYYSYANGLFLSYYDLPNGIRKYLLATQFEPIQARAMFPCYDEPNLKATFKLKVSHPSNYSAISNTRIQSIVNDSRNRKRTTFNVTPNMSTYLLALAVSDFESTALELNDNKTIRIFVPPGRKNLTDMTLQISGAAVHYFRKMLNTNYTLSKLDGIAVPTFGGGMENWGLIVYDTSIIFNYTTASINKLRSVANLICHEIAHQWFGNLVTLDWWDYVWLNEGFATYYAQRMGDYIFQGTELRFMDNHVVGLQQMMSADSSNSGESLNKHVEKPNDIRPKFNSYGYNKASAIVRFMSLIFKNFDNGITEYLAKQGLGNANPLNLFRALNKQNNTVPLNVTSVERIMKNWVDEPGYPLLTLNLTKIGNKYEIMATQEHFNFNKNVNKTGKWWIPINIAHENSTNFDPQEIIGWLSDENKNKSFNLSGNYEKGWFISNLQVATFCRVNYNLENWHNLIKFLNVTTKFHKIHHLNRAQLINDANILAKAKRLPETIVFDLLTYLKHENDSLVHKSAESVFIQYAELLKDTEVFPKFRNMVKNIYGPNVADNILDTPDWDELVQNAIDIMNNKHADQLEAFAHVADHVYNEEDLLNVRKATTKMSRTSQFINQIEFLDKINERAQFNAMIKEKFMTNNNYDEVKKWFDSRY